VPIDALFPGEIHEGAVVREGKIGRARFLDEQTGQHIDRLAAGGQAAGIERHRLERARRAEHHVSGGRVPRERAVLDEDRPRLRFERQQADVETTVAPHDREQRMTPIRQQMRPEVIGLAIGCRGSRQDVR
jgi:hypothetical protein